jgi:hypothetical protein
MGEDTEHFSAWWIFKGKGKVHPRQAMGAHKGSRGIAPFFLISVLGGGLVVSATPWPIYPQERDLAPTVSEAGWAPGLVWTGTENLAPTGIQFLDHPPRSELLHRLHYPTHMKNIWHSIMGRNFILPRIVMWTWCIVRNKKYSRISDQELCD